MEQMDSETLRLLLAVAGVFVIASVYVWGRYKKKLLDFITNNYSIYHTVARGDPANKIIVFLRGEGPAPKAVLIFEKKEDHPCATNTFFSHSGTK